MVFDEIDAGIGGQTAHAVGETLRRLAERAQVVTITHLPQIAIARRPPLPRREGSRRPDAHDDRRSSATTSAATSCERMLGGEQFIAAVQQER